MSVSHQQRQTSAEVIKGTYFVANDTLYYIIDVDAQSRDNQPFWVEDCYTNYARWWTVDEMMGIRKEVIEPNE